MKIVLITDLYLPNIGGVEAVVSNLAEEFKNKGHKVIVIAARTPRALPSRDIISGVEIHRLDFILPAPRFKSILGFLILGMFANIKLILLLKRTRPEVVNAHFVYANGSYTLLTKKLIKYPLVVSVHGNDVQQFPSDSKICRWVLENLLKSADFVTGCSASLLNEAKQFAPELLKKSRPVPNGISLGEFEQNGKYTHSKPYIFSIGRFVYKKGFDILLRAFKKVAENNSNVDLIVAGTGEEWQKCVRLVEELDLGKRVMLIGFVERKEVIKLYKGCEFFILPSRREPFGITNLEAMAAGKAIVAADVDGIPELIKNGENGILFKPENDTELAEKILFLLENDNLKERMGRQGKLIVEKKYDWSLIADSYINIYENIINIEFEGRK